MGRQLTVSAARILYQRRSVVIDDRRWGCHANYMKRHRSIKRAELDRLRALAAARRPQLRTWIPHGTRNALAVQLWIAVDALAAARGQPAARTHAAILEAANQLAGDALAQSRATTAAERRLDAAGINTPDAPA